MNTPAQQAHIKTTSIQRWSIVKTLSQHCFNILCPLGVNAPNQQWCEEVLSESQKDLVHRKEGIDVYAWLFFFFFLNQHTSQLALLSGSYNHAHVNFLRQTLYWYACAYL